jgi:hypothetical protein
MIVTIAGINQYWFTLEIQEEFRLESKAEGREYIIYQICLTNPRVIRIIQTLRYMITRSAMNIR